MKNVVITSCCMYKFPLYLRHFLFLRRTYQDPASWSGNSRHGSGSGRIAKFWIWCTPNVCVFVIFLTFSCHLLSLKRIMRLFVSHLTSWNFVWALQKCQSSSNICVSHMLINSITYLLKSVAVVWVFLFFVCVCVCAAFLKKYLKKTCLVLTESELFVYWELYT